MAKNKPKNHREYASCREVESNERLLERILKIRLEAFLKNYSFSRGVRPVGEKKVLVKKSQIELVLC
jgi:hypothetical protein